MNSREHIEKFLRERDRISHDLVQNVFFAALQPCGDGAGRLGDADLIYAALLGMEDAVESAREVMDAWRSQIAPAILLLLKDIPRRRGLVPSEKWVLDAEAMRAACDALSAVSFDTALSSAAARSSAEKFWAASDTMYRILSAIKTDFAGYFLRWDRALIDV